MNNDRMKILKMLESKQITAEEATKLLESLNNSGDRNFSNPDIKNVNNTQQNNTQQNNFDNIKSNNTNQSSDSDFRQQNRNQQYNNQNKNNPEGPSNLENFTQDLSKKMEVLAKDLGPKLTKFTEKVVSATSDVANKVSDSFKYKEPSRSSGGYSKTTHTASSKNFGQEAKSVEISINDVNNQLNLSSLNGSVLLKGYNGDKITAKIYYTKKSSSGDINIVKLGNKYLLDYDESNFKSISIDAFIPENMFESIFLDSTNSDVSIDTIKTKHLIVNNLNNPTELKNIAADNIKITCNNNTLKLDNVFGNIAKIENFNGNVNINNLDVENLRMDTFNGSINVTVHEYKLFNEYMWEIESSNGSIVFNLPSYNDLSYYLNLRTSIANVKVGLVGLDYLANQSNFIEARSINYDSVNKHVLLRLETSNAPIVIN